MYVLSNIKTHYFVTFFSCFYNCQKPSFTAQKIKFSTTDFSSKCYQIHSFLRIWSHLLKKSLMENFIFCALIASLIMSSLIMRKSCVKFDKNAKLSVDNTKSKTFQLNFVSIPFIANGNFFEQGRNFFCRYVL